MLQVVRGDTSDFDIAIIDSITGLPYNLAGRDITFSAKRRYRDDDPIIVKTIGDGITVIDAAAGLALLTIAAADTEDLADRALVWDLELRLDDDVRTPLWGRLAIVPDVTQVSGS